MLGSLEYVNNLLHQRDLQYAKEYLNYVVPPVPLAVLKEKNTWCAVHGFELVLLFGNCFVGCFLLSWNLSFYFLSF